ncbi:hypothetical protein D6817_01485 [Candidatus Pacearchaeota archaeon]|nr:MAG: hypothetical protein D6817_01485 [Candidatus Pacearchaeota archaeon]
MNAKATRKILQASLACVFMIALLSSLASAQFADKVQRVVNDAADAIRPITDAVIGELNLGSPGNSLFGSILIIILVFTLVWTVLEKIEIFSTHRWVLWLLSIVVTLLATRWVGSQDWVQTVILPYSTFGITISAIFPFVLFFLFLNVGFQGATYSFIRKTGWLFFAVVFIGLWFSRYDELANAKWVYPIVALLAFLMMFFDGTVSKFFMHQKLARAQATFAQDAINSLLEKRQRVQNLMREGILTPEEGERQIQELNKRINYWVKKM